MKVFKENNFFGNKLSGNVSKMLNLRKNNRFIKELEEVKRKSPPADMELRELMVHTNGIESFWALLKRGYYGVYHKMSVKHLQRYIDEFCGRCNVRQIDTIDQTDSTTHGFMGARKLT